MYQPRCTTKLGLAMNFREDVKIRITQVLNAQFHSASLLPGIYPKGVPAQVPNVVNKEVHCGCIKTKKGPLYGTS